MATCCLELLYSEENNWTTRATSDYFQLVSGYFFLVLYVNRAVTVSLSSVDRRFAQHVMYSIDSQSVLIKNTLLLFVIFAIKTRKITLVLIVCCPELQFLLRLTYGFVVRNYHNQFSLALNIVFESAAQQCGKRVPLTSALVRGALRKGRKQLRLG